MTPREQIQEIQRRVNQSVIGQERVVERLLIALLANGNVLVEGLPGLAKTRAIKSLSTALESKFSRIQFTPDLLPSDVTGGEIYLSEAPGRAPSSSARGRSSATSSSPTRSTARRPRCSRHCSRRWRSARSRSPGKRYNLPDLFMVLATQNPIEQEGTYPLPEAQMDRFLMHVRIGYPSDADEVKVLRLVRGERRGQARRRGAEAQVPQQAVFDARAEIDQSHDARRVENYIVALVAATRRPAEYGDKLENWIKIGASPRGSLALDRALAGPCLARTGATTSRPTTCRRSPTTACATASPSATRRPPRASRNDVIDEVVNRSPSRLKAWRDARRDRSAGTRLRRARRAGPAAAPRARVQPPAAPAGAQPARRAACLAAARPRPRFRGAAPLCRGRRHAHDRLAGDGAAAAARMSASTPRSATAACCCVVDQRASMFFGSRRAMKSVAAAEAAALAAWRVTSLGDRVGAIVFSDDDGIVESSRRRARPGVMRILARWCARTGCFGRDGPPADPALLNEALRRAARLATHDWLVCLISRPGRRRRRNAPAGDPDHARITTCSRFRARPARGRAARHRPRRARRGRPQIEIDTSGTQPARATSPRASRDAAQAASISRATRDPGAADPDRPRRRRAAARPYGPAPRRGAGAPREQSADERTRPISPICATSRCRRRCRCGRRRRDGGSWPPALWRSAVDPGCPWPWLPIARMPIAAQPPANSRHCEQALDRGEPRLRPGRAQVVAVLKRAALVAFPREAHGAVHGAALAGFSIETLAADGVRGTVPSRADRGDLPPVAPRCRANASARRGRTTMAARRTERRRREPAPARRC